MYGLVLLCFKLIHNDNEIKIIIDKEDFKLYFV